MQPDHSELLRPPQAALYLGLSTSTLAKHRVTGDGPRYYLVTPEW